MGIFEKLKNWFQSSEYQPNEPPVTGGQAYAQAELFNAIARMNEPGYGYDESYNPFKPYEPYWELLQMSNYFANLIPLETGNGSVMLNWTTIWQLVWLYGMAAVQVFGEGEDAKIKVYALSSLALDEYNEPKGAEGVLSKNWLSLGNADATPERMARHAQPLSLHNLIILKANPQGLNAWITWRPFLEARDALTERLNVVVNMNMKKLVIEGIAPNETAARELLRSLEKPKSAIFMYSLTDKDGKIRANNLNLRSLDLKPNPVAEFTELIDWHTNYWYSLLGKRYNDAYKKERNLVAEIDEAQSNFNVLESYQKREARRLKRFLEGFGVEIEIEPKERKDDAMARMADDRPQGRDNNQIAAKPGED